MSKVRSNELETRLSSSDDPMEVGDDTAVIVPQEVRAFFAFGEECGLDAEILSRFIQRFQFPNRVKVRLPRPKEQACHFSLGEVCFYEAAFLSGRRFPVHPMEIWLAATDRDMIKVDKLVYLYCLKEPKEYGYYELVSWVREARIVKDLPFSFRYWKSQFFFVSEDEFETLPGEVWGDVPRLLCQ